MNKEEAIKLINNELNKFREKSYSELITMIDGDPITGEIEGTDGKKYQFEIQAYWDGTPDSDVRIMGSIDDGGWRAFSPLTESFIKSPSNEFVDE